MNLAERIQHALALAPMTVTELARALSCSKGAVRHHASELRAQGAVHHLPADQPRARTNGRPARRLAA